MSLFGHLMLQPQARIDSSHALWELIVGGAMTKSGAEVTITAALRVSTVLACARVVAEDIAKLPFRLMRDEGQRKSPAAQHPVYWLLRHKPNAWQTPFEFRETLTLHAFLAKGGFAFINRVRGEPRELLPLVPGHVTVRRVGWDVEYEIQGLGTVGARDVLHVRGPSWNGYQGLEMVRQASEAIGLAQVTEEAQALLHKNGARPGGILAYPNGLEPEQKADIAKAWNTAFGGGNLFGTAVLDLGAKYEQLAMTGVDAQTLESRRFQVEEMCRFLRVYPAKIGHTDKTATFASAAEFNRAHVVDSIQPWTERWEQSSARSLLTEQEIREGYYAKLDTRMLLEADPKARGEYYKASLGTASSPGWNTPNDIRRLEDQDPSDTPGADKLVTVDSFPKTSGGGSRQSEGPP